MLGEARGEGREFCEFLGEFLAGITLILIHSWGIWISACDFSSCKEDKIVQESLYSQYEEASSRLNI